jgi:hypothetical protein
MEMGNEKSKWQGISSLPASMGCSEMIVGLNINKLDVLFIIFYYPNPILLVGQNYTILNSNASIFNSYLTNNSQAVNYIVNFSYF